MNAFPVLILALFLHSSWAYGFQALPKTPPIPANNQMTPEKIELGRKLYFDTRLSDDNTVSCNTCHQVNQGGVDGLPTSKGIKGQFGGRNSPTVINAAYLSVQFWDGRAPSLEEQAKGPITNPIEMGMKDHGVAIKKLQGIPGYVQEFEKVFGKDSLNIDNVAKAIAAYERTLVTPNSPFDQYMAGKKSAMSKQAIAGMAKFQALGCVACHSGPAFAGPALPEGSGFYQKFPTFEDNEYVFKYDFKSDLGRYEATKKDSDKHFWRVPTLRNIAQTGPYFHNGKVASLEEAVRIMAKTQLHQDISDADTKAIVAFLNSLTGKLPKQKEPKLP